MTNPYNVLELMEQATKSAAQEINAFAKAVLRTRGGRIGSGMGTLLEALWGYYVNQVLASNSPHLEIAWLPEHEYNDFACIVRDETWDPSTKKGEVLRVEAKSMNIDADESKGHFDELWANIGELDLLLVLIWSWRQIDHLRVSPQIIDYFVGSARSVASFRDALHIARGGSFVSRYSCPDNHDFSECTHDGDPLNASGKRERISGPDSRRPSTRVSYAANFGGLVRMMKTNSEDARSVLRKMRLDDDTIHSYITFIHRNYPSEEFNQYLTSEWQQLASLLRIEHRNLSKIDLVSTIRANFPDYRTHLRDIYRTRS